MEVLEIRRGARAGEISDGVEEAIRAGRLRPGDSLPTVRSLAGRLGVSPTTVAAAYRGLHLRGMVGGDGRRGTRVSQRPPIAAHLPPPLPAGARDLASGNPDPELLPELGPWLAAMAPPRRLYGEPANRRDLLDLAAARLALDGVSSDFLAITGGGMDGVERVLAAHLRPGDRVVVEDPGFPPVRDLLLALGLAAVPVPVDDRGLRPEELERALSSQVAGLVMSPRAQNPTGAALDPDRVADLAAVLARRPGLVVVEDDHAGPVGGPLKGSLAASGRERWAHVRSLSKSLGPDLRLAVVAGDAVTIARVEGRQLLGTGWVSGVLQELAVRLWSDPGVEAGVAAAAERYRERRVALVAALAAEGVEVGARSGFNCWLPVVDEPAAVRAALAAGWAVAAGARFRHRTGPAIRVSTATLDPAEAPEVARVLAPLAASG